MSDGEGTPSGNAEPLVPVDRESACDEPPEDSPMPPGRCAEPSAGDAANADDDAHPVDMRQKKRTVLVVCVTAVLLAVGVVAVLSWASSLGGGTGDPIDTTLQREPSAGEPPVPAGPAGTAAPASVSALEISFDSGMSVTLSANGRDLTWDAGDSSGSQSLDGIRLSDDGSTATVSFADSENPSSVSLAIRKASSGFVAWKCGMLAEDGARLSFAGSITGLPERAGVELDLTSLTASCSPKGDTATPLISMSLSRMTDGGILSESVDASLSLGRGAADASLTTTMREMTMRSSAGVGHGTTLTGMRTASSPGESGLKTGVGGTVTLDDGVREYVANYDEIAQRATAEKETDAMPALVTEASGKPKGASSVGSDKAEPSS